MNECKIDGRITTDATVKTGLKADGNSWQQTSFFMSHGESTGKKGPDGKYIYEYQTYLIQIWNCPFTDKLTKGTQVEIVGGKMKKAYGKVNPNTSQIDIVIPVDATQATVNRKSGNENLQNPSNSASSSTDNNDIPF